MIDILWGILPGLGITIKVTLASAVLALLCASVAGLALLSKSRAIRWPARVYVEIFRGTSAVVQLFWLFFVLPHFGIRLTPFEASVLGLGLNAGAYGAEIVRAGIQSVPSGQIEAGWALGLSKRQRMRLIVLPQAARTMLPPFGNMAIELLKLSSIVSLVTIGDLTFRAHSLNQTTLQTIPIFAVVLILYLLLSLTIAGTFRAAERWSRIPG
jgi:polar amino acid transport system permease protein